jgi:hypothetical protein
MLMPPRAFTPMTKGVKVRKPARASKKLSLKYRGIVQKTRIRYEAQLKIFFDYLSTYDLAIPKTWRKLDRVVSNYIDFMYHEEIPVGYAGDLLSGLARWIPGSRSNLPTARLWFRNWLREVIRQRALPIPQFVLNGIAGLALAMKRLDLAALLPLAFVCMLRTSEVYSLRKSDVAFNPSSKSAIVALRQTKTSGPNTEECVVHDPLIVQALRLLCMERKDDELLYSRPARFLGEDLKWLCKLVGFSHSRLTPYSLRRGGATWHMHAFGSLSTTALLGRWRHEKTAKIYIDGAAAEWASWQFSVEGKAMLARGTKVFKKKFAR